SGAIAGVLGAYLVLFPFARLIVLLPILFSPLFFELPAVLFIGFWALSQLFSGTLSLAYQGNIGGVAWWGHVGGFAAGILLQFFWTCCFIPRAASCWPRCKSLVRYTKIMGK